MDSLLQVVLVGVQDLLVGMRAGFGDASSQARLLNSLTLRNRDWEKGRLHVSHWASSLAHDYAVGGMTIRSLSALSEKGKQNRLDQPPGQALQYVPGSVDTLKWT